MPQPNNPSARDHFVYVCHALGYPFYVGHGHAGRLSDRPRFIDSLVRLHPDRSYGKWRLHGEVIAALWERDIEVCFDQITSGQTKAEATAHERALIRGLVDDRFVLSNATWNPTFRSALEITTEIVRGDRKWDFLLSNYEPVKRYVRPSQAGQRAAEPLSEIRTLASDAGQQGSASSSRGHSGTHVLTKKSTRSTVRERVDPTRCLALVDIDGRVRLPIQRCDGDDWRYVVGTGRSNETIFLNRIEDVIQHVIFRGRTLTCRTVGPLKPVRRSGVTVAGKSIRGYWVAPDLRHLVRAAPVAPMDALPPEV